LFSVGATVVLSQYSITNGDRASRVYAEEPLKDYCLRPVSVSMKVRVTLRAVAIMDRMRACAVMVG
jgi:hypothetical protein